MTRFFSIFSFSGRAQHRTKSQHLQVLPYDYSISILFVTIRGFLHYRAQYFFFFCHIFFRFSTSVHTLTTMTKQREKTAHTETISHLFFFLIPRSLTFASFYVYLFLYLFIIVCFGIFFLFRQN